MFDEQTSNIQYLIVGISSVRYRTSCQLLTPLDLLVACVAMMFITNIDWTDTTLPFGGVTEADYGNELGEMAFSSAQITSGNAPCRC
jgi:hypothetical protein